MDQFTHNRIVRRFAKRISVSLFALLVPMFYAGQPSSAALIPGDSTLPANQAGADGPKVDAELKDAIATAPKASDWPNNNYARLLDIANINVQSDGTVTAKYRLTYKLFNDRDRDQLAEVNLPYNSSYESIHVISARTIRRDGTVVNV